MVYKSFKKFWKNDFDNIVSSKDKVQVVKTIELKLNLNDAYKGDEKITTKFESFDDRDVINKAYLDKKLAKIESQISYIEKDYNELKLPINKQPVEEVLVQRAVKTTIQRLYDRGFFDFYDISDEVIKCFLFTRRRPDLE